MLYLCATPIGNLGDISYRAVETLAVCDEVWCEDTRRTAQLLNHLKIEKKLYSCHEHNERSRAELLAQALADGREIVYVSDAGMPAVSDPGYLLVTTCVEKGLPFTVLPGASAVLTAAVMSGLTPQPFSFFGFLPREGKERKQVLMDIAQTPHLVLLYESPHRVLETLQLLLETLGDVPAAVLRELTKKFETAERGTLSELTERFQTEPKGECVIAVLPKRKAAVSADSRQLDKLLSPLLECLSDKDAAAVAAKALDLPRNSVYKRILERKQGGNE